MLKVCAYVPNVGPKMNPGNVCVATFAVPTPGRRVQQWMWVAVVALVRLEKLTISVNRFPDSIMSTWPKPGDAFGGDSAGPDSSAVHVCARAVEAAVSATTSPSNFEIRVMVTIS